MAQTKLHIDQYFIDTIARIDSGELMLKEAAALLGISPPGLHKKIAKYKRQQPPESLLKLTEQRQKFCIAKASGLGNKASARIAFPDAKEESLSPLARKVLNDPDVNTTISTLLARHGMTKDHRISRLADCLSSADLNIVLKTLSETWKLDGSYAADKLDVRLATAADIRSLQALIPD